jgi:iron-sulfur cluster assembly accessory protein
MVRPHNPHVLLSLILFSLVCGVLRLTGIGVKVLIDSRALFSIIGSTMDFVEDRLSARFVFENPHVKGSCGCGESFSVS